ncbi:MAG: efflux transporter outer membrane subunit [Desulfuromonadales bacterium]|nr:efflux transporter outer membrane subunit [Desulfuromonadales bacterium]
MRFFVVLVLGVTLLSSGCAKIGPDFTQPPAPVAESWLEPDKQLTATSEHNEKWWTDFNDPVLNVLIEESYQQNLGLQIAGLRILEARAQLGIATGNLYPQQQQLSGGAAAIGNSKNAANSAGGDLYYKNLGSSMDAAWELDFWGKFRRGVEAADAQYLAATASYDDVMVTLTAEVARAYITIRINEERIRLAHESVAIQDRSLEIAENRFEGGLVTELDVQQARTLLANTRATIPRFEVDYHHARNALSVLLGQPPGDLVKVLTSPGKVLGIPVAPAEVAVGVPADLLRRRPDVRRAELQAASQSALIGVAKADLLPHFTLIGSIGLQTSESSLTRNGSSNFSDLFDSDSMTYFVGPSLTWDILNYGRIKNQVRVQDARLQQLIVNYQDTVLRAAQETEDAMISFLKTQQEARYLADAVKASQRSVDISMLQYGEGLADYQRVLDAQRSLSVGQDILASAQGSVVLNLVSMYKALGGGWQPRSDQNFINAETRQEMAERTDWGGILDEPKKASTESGEESSMESDDGSDWRWPDW